MSPISQEYTTVSSRRLEQMAGWIFLGGILLSILYKVWPGLLIPWWFNTDEVVFFYEVIRQLRLDPGQTFFDIPGTPFMTLASFLTAGWWALESIFDPNTPANASDFAFANIQGVYVLMRCVTLGCYVISVGLAYWVFRLVSGAIAGAVAATFFCTLPIYVQYSHFVRTESLGLVLCLGAILLFLLQSTRGRWQTYLVSGVLAGIAMGARFHFALVGLPVLLAIYFLHDRKTLDTDAVPSVPRKSLYAAGAVLAAIFVAGASVTVLLQKGLIAPSPLTDTLLLTTAMGPEQYAGAKATVAKLWLLLGLVSLVITTLQFSPGIRNRLRVFVNPFTLALAVGFATGFLISHPTFIWQGEHQLRSIQFYSDWVDPNLLVGSAFESWWSVTSFYAGSAFPERLLQILFLIGASLILWRRQSWPLAFLVGAGICFFAHPTTMKLWPHHVIPWLPFLSYVAAYPIGLVGTRISRLWSHPALLLFSFLTIFASLTALLAPRIQKADEYLQISLARTQQIEEMDRWLARNTPDKAYLLRSYYALNGDGMFKWIESSGVSVPDFIARKTNTEIWWLNRSSVDGKAGFVCMSRADIVFFQEDFERTSPGSTYNPFEDRRFRKLESFGEGFYELAVFEFDFRETTADS